MELIILEYQYLQTTVKPFVISPKLWGFNEFLWGENGNEQIFVENFFLEGNDKGKSQWALQERILCLSSSVSLQMKLNLNHLHCKNKFEFIDKQNRIYI